MVGPEWWIFTLRAIGDLNGYSAAPWRPVISATNVSGDHTHYVWDTTKVQA
jgi:hypothetical protein